MSCLTLLSFFPKGQRQTKRLLQPHDPQPLAWVVGIDKSSGGKKGLLGLEKLISLL